MSEDVILPVLSKEDFENAIRFSEKSPSPLQKDDPCDENDDIEYTEVFLQILSADETEWTKSSSEEVLDHKSIGNLITCIFKNFLRRTIIPEVVLRTNFRGSFFNVQNRYKFMEYLLHVIQSIFIRFICTNARKCLSKIKKDEQETLWTKVCIRNLQKFESDELPKRAFVDLIIANMLDTFISFVIPIHHRFRVHPIQEPVLPSLDISLDDIERLYPQIVYPLCTDTWSSSQNVIGEQQEQRFNPEKLFEACSMYEYTTIPEDDVQDSSMENSSFVSSVCSGIAKKIKHIIQDGMFTKGFLSTNEFTEKLHQDNKGANLVYCYLEKGKEGEEINKERDFKLQNQLNEEMQIVEEFSTIISMMDDLEFNYFCIHTQNFISRIFTPHLCGIRDLLLAEGKSVQLVDGLYTHLSDIPFVHMKDLYGMAQVMEETISRTKSNDNTRCEMGGGVSDNSLLVGFRPPSRENIIYPNIQQEIVSSLPEKGKRKRMGYTNQATTTTTTTTTRVNIDTDTESDMDTEDKENEEEQQVEEEIHIIEGISIPDNTCNIQTSCDNSSNTSIPPSSPYFMDLKPDIQLLINKIFSLHHPVLVFRLLWSIINEKLNKEQQNNSWCSHCHMPGHVAAKCFLIRTGSWNNDKTSYQQTYTVSKTQQQQKMEEEQGAAKKRTRHLKEANESEDVSLANTINSVISLVTDILSSLVENLQLISDDKDPDPDITKNEKYIHTIIRIFDVQGVITKHQAKYSNTTNTSLEDGQQLLVIQPTIPMSVMIGIYNTFEDLFWQNGKDTPEAPAIVMQRYANNPFWSTLVRELISDNKTTYPGRDMFYEHISHRSMFIYTVSSLNSQERHNAYFLGEEMEAYIKKCNKRRIIDDPRIPIRLAKDIFDHLLLASVIENARLSASPHLHKGNLMAKRPLFSKLDYGDGIFTTDGSTFSTISPKEMKDMFEGYDFGYCVPHGNPFMKKELGDSYLMERLAESYETDLPTLNLPESKNITYSQAILQRNEFLVEYTILPNDKRSIQMNRDTNERKHWGELEESKKSSSSSSVVSPSNSDEDFCCFARVANLSKTNTEGSTYLHPQKLIDLAYFYRTSARNERVKTIITEQFIGSGYNSRSSSSSSSYAITNGTKNVEYCLNNQCNILISFIHFLNANESCWGTKKRQRIFERYIYPFFLFIIFATRYSSYDVTISIYKRISFQRYASTKNTIETKRDKSDKTEGFKKPQPIDKKGGGKKRKRDSSSLPEEGRLSKIQSPKKTGDEHDSNGSEVRVESNKSTTESIDINTVIEKQLGGIRKKQRIEDSTRSGNPGELKEISQSIVKFGTDMKALGNIVALLTQKVDLLNPVQPSAVLRNSGGSLPPNPQIVPHHETTFTTTTTTTSMVQSGTSKHGDIIMNIPSLNPKNQNKNFLIPAPTIVSSTSDISN